MKKTQLFFILCICILILSGCAQKKNEGNAEGSIWQQNVCFTDTGILYKGTSADGRLEFYDYKANEYLPLCARANCSHDSIDCTAVYLYQKADFIGKVGDKWYYYALGDRQGEGTFYSCDLDGGNETEIGSFPYEEGIVTTTLFYDNVCVLATEENHFEAVTDEWTGTASTICRYHLDTGETEVLCEEKEYMRPAYSVYGKYENQLIYTEWDGERNLMKQMDLDTGETKVLLEGISIVTGTVQGETLLCSVMENEKSELVIVNLKTGEQDRVLTEGNALEYFWDEELKIFVIYGDDAVTNEEGYARWVFDMYEYEGDGTCRLLRSGTTIKCFIPYVKNGDQLIGRDSDTGKMARISVQDFLSGSTEWEIL